MSLTQDVKQIKKELKEIKEILVGGNQMNKLEKQYMDYKFFADSRGMKMLSDRGLVDEYNSFMSECEKVLFSDDKITNFSAKIELPKPSSALEAFKNKFNKFF